ncbi:MAG: dihydroneopterin aldolase [Anaerolineales bacterium]
MPEDRIVVHDLLVRGILGTNESERKSPQDILIQLTLFADLSQAGKTDRLEDTVNYRTVTKEVIAHAEKSARFTVEALAADLAAICLRHSGVQKVRVRVEKPGALRFARSVGVEIEREAAAVG